MISEGNATIRNSEFGIRNSSVSAINRNLQCVFDGADGVQRPEAQHSALCTGQGLGGLHRFLHGVAGHRLGALGLQVGGQLLDS